MSNGIGSALTIPQSALDGIQKAEDKLESLKKKAEDVATSVSGSFSKMAIGTKDFINALDTIIGKLSSINTESSKLSSSLGNLGTEKATRDVKDFGSAIENAASSVDAMSGKKISLDFSNMNIALLKDQIAEISKKINDTENLLGRKEQQAFVDMRAALNEEKKKQEMTSNATYKGSLAYSANANTLAESAQAIKYLEQAKMSLSRTDADYTQKLKTLNEEQAKHNALLREAKTVEDKNATYKGSLAYSQSAKTLEENKKAIEYLNKAKMQLDTTDANYAQRLSTLNNAITRHKQVLREAGETAANVKKQYSYLQKYTMQLAQRMAVLFTMNTAKGLVEQIAEVRGQFELSQRSLESILGNKSKADVIFQKTVNLALNSPFKIKQLVEYTRQLAAYRIENEKLFDTTKRLADVSAGLGVDMGRLILAYGQVKAAAYLRGSEVRQFTEAGVNMYGELQDYFKEVKGEAYSTAQIVDMISKRMVKFEDVEAIFKRMTDKGGMFYNMQEVQANTLYGMIQKMGDAFDKMLNDIGKSNEGILKGTVSTAIDMLKHWEDVVNVVKVFTELLAILAAQAYLSGVSLSKVFTVKFDTEIFGQLGKITALLKSAGNAAKMLGRNLLSAWPLLAVAALSHIFFKYKEMSDAEQDANLKAQQNYIKTQAAISDLANEYYRLADAKKQAGNSWSESDEEKNISERRKKLQEFIDKAEKEGITFDINVKAIDEKDLDKTFEKVKQDYNDVNNYFLNIQQKFNHGKEGLVGGYTEDMSAYVAAATELATKSEDINKLIDIVKVNYADVTGKAKEYYQVITAGQKHGESQVDYLSRVAQALIKLQELTKNTKFYDTYDWFSKTIEGDYGYGGLKSVLYSFTATKNKLSYMFKELFSFARERFQKQPLLLKAVIDKSAAENDWNNLIREAGSSWNGIPLNIDQDSVEQQAYNLDNYLRDYFSSKTYKFNLSFDLVTDTDLFDGLLNEEKKLKELKDKADKALRLLETSQIELWDKNTKDIYDLWSGDFLEFSKIADKNGGKIPRSAIIKRVRELAKMRDDAVKRFGSSQDTSKKDERKRKQQQRQAAKEQRDIISERVSLLREMNEKYNELKKIFNEKESLAYTRMYFKEAAQNVGLNVNDIIPSNEDVVNRLRELAKQYKEVGKRGDVLRIAADIEFNVKQEEYEKLTNKVSEDIEDAFAKLSLYDKLKEAGVSDVLIRKVFDDVVVSYKDLRERVDSVFKQYTIAYFNEKYGGESDKWSKETIDSFLYYSKNTEKAMSELFGEDRAKQYNDALKRIDDQEKQANIDMFANLTKEYKKNLTERLQLDKWYAEERAKILKYVDDDETRQSYLKNLDKKYKEKADANEWKDFKESDMYISLFENLDHTSTRVLEAMRDKLKNLRESLKNLSPSELKEIVKQIGELDTKINSRNPFKGLTSDIKDYISYLKTRKKLEEDYIKSKKKEDELNASLYKWNKSAIEAEQQLNDLINDNSTDFVRQDVTKTLLEVAKKKTGKVQEELDAQKKITNEIYKQIIAGNNAGNRINEKLQALKEQYGNMSGLVTSIEEMGDAWGLDVEIPDELKEIADGWDKIIDSLTNIDVTKPMSIVTSALGVVTGVGKVFGGIFGWGTKDKHLQEEIENHQKAIENLQRAYEKLKEAMSDVYDMEGMAKTTDEMIKNLELTNANLKSMIALENDKKKSDSDKIKEWQNQIEENKKAINEAKESLTESLGGFGSKSNYKAAAEAFSDAWLDAFKEGSNALDALNDKFDEYMENLMKKQLVARIAQRIFQPIFDAVDAAVAEDSDGGYNATKKEIENIRALWKERSEIFNDSAKDIIDSMGGTRDSNSNLSGLQKGISSLSESTGKELEGVLESIRYYLATQQADVRAIRDTLIAHLGNAVSNVMQGDNSSPVLTELRLQTSLLTDIRDTLSSCVKVGHSQGRSGIKVFLNN